MPYQPIDILFFAEDPGAVNYIADLPQICAEHGLSSGIIAAGSAVSILSQRGREYFAADDFASASQMLEALRPRLLVMGTSENPESLGLHLLSEAGKREIPSVGVVDAFMNAAYRFRGMSTDPLAYAPDWLIVSDPWTRDEFVRVGFRSERVEVCGHPHYDFVRAKREELAAQGENTSRQRFFPEASQDQTIILFAAEQEGGLNADQFLKSPEYTLPGRGGHTRNEIVLEEFLDALAPMPQQPYLVLRLPPKATPDEFAPYLKHFDFVSQKEPALELLYATDYVVGMTSMLLIEAAILGKPTFSIVPRQIERTWLPTVRSGITWCAHTREQIRTMVPEFLAGKSQGASDRQADSFTYGASQKAAQFFEEILCPASASGEPSKGSTING